MSFDEFRQANQPRLFATLPEHIVFAEGRLHRGAGRRGRPARRPGRAVGRPAGDQPAQHTQPLIGYRIDDRFVPHPADPTHDAAVV